MVFSSVEFLFFFLPLTLAVYALTPQSARNVALLVASLVFYTWGGGTLVFLLLTTIGANYVFGLMAARGIHEERPALRRWALVGSVVFNVGMLAWFKYANFAVDQVNAMAERLGLDSVGWAEIILPIGISFFTFQAMSYTIDVARGRTEPLRNPVDFALYVSLFPQLIAGPIVRFHELHQEIRSRSTRLEDFSEGALRFAHGLAKKVIIADAAAEIADGAFGQPTDELTFIGAWLGVVAYTIQIYFDFSGYSDMAIGLGRMFGFHFPENFRRPYSAYSITDFWRRWHITLSNWFRDYLYLPLGGSRVSNRRTYVNLFAVFMATGVWHGANWTFIVWGLYHGVIMLAERVGGGRRVDDAPRPWLARATTLLLVMIGWVMFRAPDIGSAFGFYGAMLNPFAGGALDPVGLGLTYRTLFVVVLACGVVLLPRDFYGGQLIERSRDARVNPARIGLIALALPYTAMLVASGTFSPFLYFQF
ncbi:MAG: MBOAT family protein [Actinomycetota bacterium]|nr:MBOAT family protein [Actinomycetota bacterium]